MQQLSAALSFDDFALLHSYDDTGAANHYYALFRITAIHRNRIEAVGESGPVNLLCPSELQPVSQYLAVGDWVMAEAVEEHWRIKRVIEARNRLQRLSDDKPQLIAANLDYLWIVTSANQDFNLKRLQRYLTLALDSGVEPVLILTKSDLCSQDELDEYLNQLRTLKCYAVHAVSVFSPPELTDEYTGPESLKVYIQPGNSIALAGSSGVGKSSLLNYLAGDALGKSQQVDGIRSGDDKGRHTTTARQLFFIPAETDPDSADKKPAGQVAVIDTPGMRELQLMNNQSGLEAVFSDIHTLTLSCRFNDCHHGNEPGCAVQQALANGSVRQSDFDNYLKLLKEDEYVKRRDQGKHAEREHQRTFTKMVNRVIRDGKS